jgi:hypothetical protein
MVMRLPKSVHGALVQMLKRDDAENEPKSSGRNLHQGFDE